MLPVTDAFESPFLHDALYQQEFMDHFSFKVMGDSIVASADKYKIPIAVKMWQHRHQKGWDKPARKTWVILNQYIPSTLGILPGFVGQSSTLIFTSIPWIHIMNYTIWGCIKRHSDHTHLDVLNHTHPDHSECLAGPSVRVPEGAVFSWGELQVTISVLLSVTLEWQGKKTQPANPVLNNLWQLPERGRTENTPLLQHW